MLLQDKVVLVTGSTTGIGRAIARRCVDEGARVMLHGRNETRASALHNELGEATHYCLADLASPDAAETLVSATVSAFGRIDVLINNAAIYPRNNIDDLTSGFFDRVMTINLKAPLFLIQHAVGAFRKQQSPGVVVNIGSINAHCGQTDILVYSASKGALMTVTRNLGDALGPEGIRVNHLNVGWTVTETEHELKQKEGLPLNWESLIPKTYAPSGRLLHPEDVAAHAVFWASDQSAPVNGQVYELEQYPIIGRNLINQLKLSDLIERDSDAS